MRSFIAFTLHRIMKSRKKRWIGHVKRKGNVEFWQKVGEIDHYEDLDHRWECNIIFRMG